MKTIALITLIAGSAMANATLLYSTNYDSFASSALVGQDSWKTDENPFNTDLDVYQISTDQAFSGTKSLRFDTSRANFGNNWAFREIDWVPTVAKDKLVTTVMVYASSGSSPYSAFGIDATTNLPSVGQRIAAVRIDSNGAIYMVEETGVRTYSANTTTTNAWHQLKLVIDFSTYTATSFVDGVSTGVTIPFFALSVASADLSSFAAGSQAGFFDNYSVSDQGRTISGIATYKQFGADVSAHPLTYEVVDSGNGIVQSGTAATDHLGFFSIDTSLPAGTYTLRGKADHWLSGIQTFTITGSGSAASVDFSMENGDVDNDNVVSVFDYINLSDAFDSTDGDANWLPAADLDGDGVVSVFDYITLSDNFDFTGL